jgi:hypothetical protein
MVKPLKFKQPPKVKGRAMVPMSLKADPIDKEIVKNFAARVSETAGIKVSSANVLMTSFYQQWPEERKKKLKLEKEAYGRKHTNRS